jgi:hypothetical protein
MGKPRPMYRQFFSNALIHSLLVLKKSAMSVAEGALSPPSEVQIYRTAMVSKTGIIGSAESLDRALMIASSSKKPHVEV